MKKDTQLVLSDEPGPGHYLLPSTVGNIPEWNDFEANPRPIIEGGRPKTTN